MIHPIIEEQMAQLRLLAPEAEATSAPDGQTLIQVPDVPLEPANAWNRSSTRVWFVAPLGYPQARPDCFWAEPDLRLAGGGLPTNTGFQPLPGLGQEALWFSWHVSTWNPNEDSLATYLKVIRRRLLEGK